MAWLRCGATGCATEACLLFTQWQTYRDGHQNVREVLWDEESEEAENDVMGLSTSFLTTQVCCSVVVLWFGFRWLYDSMYQWIVPRMKGASPKKRRENGSEGGGGGGILLNPSTSIRTGPRPRGEGSPVFPTICELSSN